MIEIDRPEIVSGEDFSTLQANITVDGKRDLVWFKVEKKYEQYLCYERSDGFIIACLNYAMRNGHDIICKAPITEELYYNIEKVLIPGLVNSNPSWHNVVIDADIATEKLPSAGAVGTGISCGVDSLHVLASQTNLKFKQHNITHLTFNNVGSHGEGEKASKLYNERLSLPRRFANEYGYEFVPSDSNIMDVIQQNHFKTHTYSSLFAIYCLQKLYSVYYYASSSYKYSDFTLVDKKTLACGSYEIWSLPLLSTRQLRIYSEGENLTRMDKLKVVASYEPSFHYLNVCLKEEHNCGKCEKCIRTLLGLDVIGALDCFKDVFDIDYYKKNRSWYIQQLLYRKQMGKHDYYEMYSYFKDSCTPIMHLKAFFYGIGIKFLPTIQKSTWLYSIIKKVI